MRGLVRSAAFALLMMGTIGLLIDEFVTGWGRAAILAFAVSNCAGLAILVATHFCRKGGRQICGVQGLAASIGVGCALGLVV